MSLNNLEKIESTLLYPARNFSIKNAVVLGRKNKSGYKLDPIYTSTYKSEKYTNYNELRSISLQSSDYFVLSYIDSYNDVYEEIYMSYPHIHKFDKFIKKCIQIVKGGVPNVYKNKTFIKKDGTWVFNPEYKDLVLSIKNLIGGKSIGAYFDIVPVAENVYDRGIVLVLNNDNYMAELSLDTLESISYFMDRFDLLTSSQNLLQLALSEEIRLNGGVTSSKSTTNTPVNQNRSLRRRPRRVLSMDKDTSNETEEMTFDDLNEDIDDILNENDVSENLDVEEEEEVNEIIEDEIHEEASNDQVTPKEDTSHKKLQSTQETTTAESLLNSNMDDIMAGLDDELDFDLNEDI